MRRVCAPKRERERERERVQFIEYHVTGNFNFIFYYVPNITR